MWFRSASSDSLARILKKGNVTVREFGIYLGHVDNEEGEQRSEKNDQFTNPKLGGGASNVTCQETETNRTADEKIVNSKTNNFCIVEEIELNVTNSKGKKGACQKKTSSISKDSN